MISIRKMTYNLPTSQRLFGFKNTVSSDVNKQTPSLLPIGFLPETKNMVIYVQQSSPSMNFDKYHNGTKTEITVTSYLFSIHDVTDSLNLLI
jgi:hypothetical protein